LNCGYHYSPKQYFADNGSTVNNERNFAPVKVVPPAPKPPTDYLPLAMVERSFASFDRNNLFLFLASLFTERVAIELCKKYLIGTSKHWPGANIFWQIDSQERIRTGKIMAYSPTTGKRVREPYDHITWVHTVLKRSNYSLSQCFFGEHLLSEHPGRTCHLVESEKTAIICAAHFPELIWLATGGKYGCKWYDKNVAKVLIGRKVRVYPDADAYEKWKEKAEDLKQSLGLDVTVSDYLDKTATEEQKREGYDIADLLVKRCETTGLALVHPGYPLAFDFGVIK
jgi:hypothetical protein